MAEIEEYRGIWWNSYTSLAKKLGVSVNTVTGWLKKHKGMSVRDYIDLALKDYTYGEYVANEYVGKYRYKNLEWADMNDLSVSLNTMPESIWAYLRKDKHRTVRQYIDYKMIKNALETCNIENVTLLKHNQDLYNQILEKMYEGYHSIFYSEATGLGKTYVALQLVNSIFHDMRVLYVVPKLAIWSEINTYSEFDCVKDIISMRTFASFNDSSVVEEVAEKYDVIFVDECHHIQSDIQGANVSEVCNLICGKGGYAFGMTATPYVQGAYIDDKYFSVSCYGRDIYSAIADGLLPKLRYAVAIEDDVEVSDDMNAKVTVDSANLALSKMIADNSSVEHWLGFFARVEDLLGSVDSIKRLLPEYKIFSVYVGSKDKAASVLREFNAYSGKSILLSVSMLLEGVHLRKCDGVLLFRSIKSDITLWQVIGRVCHYGSERPPVILDVTHSYSEVDTVLKRRCSQLNERKLEWKDIFDIKCREYKYIQMFENLKQYRKKEYREIIWYDLAGLARSLNMAVYDLRLYMVRNSLSEQEVVDCKLKDASYKEFVANGFKGFYEHKGYKWSNRNELVSQFSKSLGCIDSWLKKNSGKNEKDFVDYMISKTEVYEYRGVKYDKTLESLTEALGLKSTSSLRDWLKKAGTTDKTKYIDFRLQDSTYEEYINNGYRGFKRHRGMTWSDRKELAEKLGRERTSVNQWLAFNKERTEYDYVDFILDKQEVYEYRGVVYDNTLQSVANALGIRLGQQVKLWLQNHGETDVRKYIDFKLQDKSYEEYMETTVSVSEC